VGEIPLDRIVFNPLPATEQDLLDLAGKTDRLYDLVNGVLVAKPLGLPESVLATSLICFLGHWIMPRNLGAVVGAGGMMRLAPGLVRQSEVAFSRWDRFPNRQVQLDVPIPDLVPDLAVEILRPDNTTDEIRRKRDDYFTRGTQLVWIIDPRVRTVEVFTAPTVSTLLQQTDTLDGGTVLPGFTLPLQQLFAVLDPH
jgi:Uma2 family endonuclease